MRLMDVMTSPWAITPNMLSEIRGIYEAHLRGPKIDLAEVEARIGRPLNNSRTEYQVVNGVAVIDASGVIAKRMNLFMDISGGVSTEILQNQIETALADKDTKSLLLNIDSPGGTVDGTFELADRIYALRGEKLIVAMANGLMASAAYAIGSAADAIYMTGPTTHVGSIGVVATHVDVSGAEQQAGIKTTEIYAGKYKRIASQYEPLTAEGRESIQDAVDYLYSVFVQRVAKFRNVAVSTVLDDMAEGRIFIGQQAIDAGLVDGVSSIESVIEALSQGQLPEPEQAESAGDARRVIAIGRRTGMSHTSYIAADEIEKGSAVSLINTEDSEMSETEITKGYVAEHHPDIAEAFRAEGADNARTEGATAERERIQAVLAQSMPGHEKLINTLAFDGKTTGPEAAVQILQAEKANSNKAAADIQADAEELAKVPASNGEEPDLASLPVEERAKAKWDADPKLRADFGDRFETYLAYAKNAEKGKVKISGKGRAA